MKKQIAFLLAAAIMATTVGCSGAPAPAPAPDAAKPAADAAAPEAPASAEKLKLKFYGKVIEYTSGPKMCDALAAELGDKYDIEMIQVDWGNMDKVIRTGIASNEPCDVYNYPSNSMVSFKDQAIDLTPYLDADGGAWRKSFDPAVLEMGTVDGKVLSIPWEVNFPALIGNKKIFDEVGITIPQNWTYEEFMAACQKLTDAGYFPFATPMDLAQGGWLFRNAMLSAAVNNGTYDQYITGEVDFTGKETTDALNAIKALYDSKYMYPGDGAVIAKTDEIRAAFLQGKVAMIANVAAGAKAVFTDASFEGVSIPWPSVGAKPGLSGVANGLFIPKNAKNVDASVELIKTFTGAKIQEIHAADGYLPANAGVQITDPFVKGLAAQAKDAYGFEFPSVTAFIDYYNTNLMPDLILNGGVDVVKNSLEKIRQDYLANK